jgi:hypothetical protein
MFVLLGGLGGNPEDLGIKMKYPWIAPRVGAAYRLSDDTVVRAGYGLTIDPLPFARPLRGFYPLTIAQTFPGPNPFQPVRTLEQGIPAFSGPDLSSGRVPLPPTADMRSPGPDEINRGYIHSWNVVYERKLPLDFVASVGYVGTASRNQLADLDINAAEVGQGQAGRPVSVKFGRTAATTRWDGFAKADYHALQVSVNRPFLRGLLVKGAYTLSRAKDETSGGPFGGADDDGWAGLAWNAPSALSRNYALAGYDRTHVFQLGFVAELPVGRNGQGGALNPIIRDWQVNAIVSAYSGAPFTVTAPDASLNAPGNRQVADQVATPSRTGGVEIGKPIYDVSAWKPVTEVRFGTGERNGVRGPGNHNVDLSIFRNFPFRGQAKVEARMEVFNLFNTPVFNNPGGSNGTGGGTNNVTSRTFMLVTSSVQSFDRQIRFGIRVSF